MRWRRTSAGDEPAGERRAARGRLRGQLLEALALVVTLAVAGWLRLDGLDRFIASDELRWTCRSINFHVALTEGAWDETFQVGHPGVVTMWLGTAALPLERVGEWRELCRTTDGGKDLSKLDDVGMEGTLQSIAPLTFQARRGIALGSLVLLLIVYVLIRRGVGVDLVPALCGLALLAGDPFLIAHTRVLHVDAMTALLCLASVAALAAARPGDRVRTVVSGAVGGLAVLAKVAAAVLGPFGMAVSFTGGYSAEGFSTGARRALVWAAAAAVAFALAWPAMWTSPGGTLRGVAAKALSEGGAPHASGNYFMGQPVDDPGPFFYPVAGLFRLTPWASLGLLAIVVLLVVGVGQWRRRRGEDDGAQSYERGVVSLTSRDLALLTVLVAWAAYFALILTLGPKKFDRYLLPALVALNLAAGLSLGWLGVGLLKHLLQRATGTHGADVRSLKEPSSAPLRGEQGPRAESRGRELVWGFAIVALLFVLQAREALRWHPYQLSYYNPLLGGARVARDVLLVGWGEGYDLAADWLNSLEAPEELEASARGVSNFAPLFKGRTRSAPGYRPGATDYVVLYSNQVQRRRNDSLLEQYYDRDDLAPVFVGEVAGIPLVWVYPNETIDELEAEIQRLALPDDVLVAGGETVFAKRYELDQPLVRFWGHWGEEEMVEALKLAFPAEWERAWVVRYPEQDPEIALSVLERVARRGETRRLAGGQIELTPFTRSAEKGQSGPSDHE